MSHVNVKRIAGLGAAWLLSVLAAVGIALFAVNNVGDSLTGRGPMGDEVDRSSTVVPPEEQVKDKPEVRDTVDGEFGSFVVGCRGAYALGLDAKPAEGWRVVSYEPGPDDDVDAVFSSGSTSIDLEVFCNRGRPEVAELERHELPGSD